MMLSIIAQELSLDKAQHVGVHKSWLEKVLHISSRTTTSIGCNYIAGANGSIEVKTYQ